MYSGGLLCIMLACISVKWRVSGWGRNVCASYNRHLSSYMTCYEAFLRIVSRIHNYSLSALLHAPTKGAESSISSTHCHPFLEQTCLVMPYNSKIASTVLVGLYTPLTEEVASLKLMQLILFVLFLNDGDHVKLVTMIPMITCPSKKRMIDLNKRRKLHQLHVRRCFVSNKDAESLSCK